MHSIFSQITKRAGLDPASDAADLMVGLGDFNDANCGFQADSAVSVLDPTFSSSLAPNTRPLFEGSGGILALGPMPSTAWGHMQANPANTSSSLSAPTVAAAASSSASTAFPYPYNDVCYITDSLGQGSGVIIGPHTVLTASHLFWNAATGQAASNVAVYPGYSFGGQPITGPEVWHYFEVGQASKFNSQYDYAVIDFASDLSSHGSFGIQTNYSGGSVHLTGYPAWAGGAQIDVTGTVFADPQYSVLDYGSISASPGDSGGPIWINEGTTTSPVPYVVGVVSTNISAVQLTTSDWQTIQGWESSDSSLWTPTVDLTTPASVVYAKMYGVAPSSTELTKLVQFDNAQYSYATSIHVLDAIIYVYQALGEALAEMSDTGSTAFKNAWGPAAIPSDATFCSNAYANVFGVAGTQLQIQHFINQVSFFESLYASSGAYGTDLNRIDLLARGAVYGQMLGVKAENPGTTASAGDEGTVPLIGVHLGHDIAHQLT